MDAVLTFNGKPVKIDNLDPDSLVFNVRGFLSSFVVSATQKKYLAFDATRSDVLTIFRESTRDYSGYFEEDEYLYVMSNATGSNLNALPEYDFIIFLGEKRFQELKPAVNGDMLKVDLMEITPPYNEFYKKKTYTFPHDGSIVSYASYERGGYRVDLDTIEQLVASSPDGSAVSSTVNQGFYPTQFYNNHLALLDQQPEDEKELFVEEITKTALRVGMINNRIFPILTSNCTDSPDLINNLIDDIKLDWQFSPFLDDADRTDVYNYNRGLARMYKFIFRNQTRIMAEECASRIALLVRILSPTSLSVLSVQAKFQLLDYYLERRDDFEENEDYVLKVIYSVTQDQVDTFLRFLLQPTEDNKTTYYELLFNTFTDDRYQRQIPMIGPLLGWLNGVETNKKRFVYAIYNLWKRSYYNPNFIPDGETPDPVTGLNPNSFFLLPAGEQYYPVINDEGELASGANPVFEYYYSKSDDIYETEDKTYYEVVTPFNGVNVQVNKVRKITQVVIDEFSHEDPYNDPVVTKHGDYHLYQPIFLVNYNQDAEVAIPDSDAVPIFLFLYSEEFKEFKKVDAQIAFAGEVALEIGLFFITGGVGVLRHLRHLRHLTKIGKVVSNTIPVTEAVLFWRGAKVGAELVSVSAGVVGAYITYNDAVNPDDPVAAPLRYFFMLLALGTSGVASVSEIKTVDAANDVLRAIPDDGNFTAVPEDVMDVVRLVADASEAGKLVFRSKLDELNNAADVDITNIITRFDGLSDDYQRFFWRDFNEWLESPELAKWERLNDPNVLNRWEQLADTSVRQDIDIPYSSVRADRRKVEFLENENAVNRYLELVEDTVSRNELYALTDVNTRLRSVNVLYIKNIQHPDILANRNMTLEITKRKTYRGEILIDGPINLIETTGGNTLRFKAKTPEIVEQVIRVYGKTDAELQTRWTDILNNVNSQYVYDPNSANMVQFGIPVSPSSTGKTPDFSSNVDFLYNNDPQMANITIKFTGNDVEDFRAANLAAGIPASACKKGKITNPPEGYTWHHMNNFNPVTGEVTLQLVKTDLHDATKIHIGASIYYNFFGLNRAQNIIEVIN